jgi:peptide/nickel transport system ATP-binding protein
VPEPNPANGPWPHQAAALIETHDLVKEYRVRRSRRAGEARTVRAVDGVSLTIQEAETFGLVGESGCGKSTLGALMLRLTPPTGGQALFEGRDLSKIRGQELRALRRDMQMIFQDPLGALDPRFSVGQAIEEPLRAEGRLNRRQRQDRVAHLMEEVGIDPAKMGARARELSGGQRQRVVIARAIALSPKFIVADEPVSALDVSVQAQILNLLRDLQRRHQITYLLVSHDLAVVRHMADRVAVMYLGKIVELGPTHGVLKRPAHPYTQALRAAVPAPDPRMARRAPALAGELPSAVNVPSGCNFRTRCPFAAARCISETPELRPVLRERFVACHRAEEIAAVQLEAPSGRSQSH